MAKMKYKSSLSYPNEGTNDTPFNNNLKEFDEFIGESRKRERAWRRVAFGLLGFLLASALGWFYLAKLPKAIPYVIEVQPWGESKYMGNVGQAETAGISIPDAFLEVLPTEVHRVHTRDFSRSSGDPFQPG